ncbi:MAG: APH(3') family aminoglycoside O-phosphotransferase [Candidatus Hodarchaeales archaeon]|jgi:aminoglycoside phosphotransferase
MNKIANFSINFPEDLRELVKPYSLHKIQMGLSGTNTFKLIANNHPNLFLKTNPCHKGLDLFKESEKLKWLSGQLPVPEVKYYSNYNGNQVLLLSEIKGIVSFDPSLVNQRSNVVSLLAQGLKLIHSIDYSSCPFDNSLKVQLKNAKYRMDNNLVNTDDFDEKRKGMTAEQLYKDLLSTQPEDEDLVFTHGDYCLPNVLIENSQLSGFVDWGNSGISDRYQDIALGLRSLEYNFGKGWDDLFLNEYGVKDLNNDKVEFYQLLDEFF